MIYITYKLIKSNEECIQQSKKKFQFQLTLELIYEQINSETYKLEDKRYKKYCTLKSHSGICSKIINSLLIAMVFIWYSIYPNHDELVQYCAQEYRYSAQFFNELLTFSVPTYRVVASPIWVVVNNCE